MVEATLSATVITDASRALAVDGDARASDSSVGIWGTTTNLVTNGGFEVDLRRWSAAFGALTEQIEHVRFGDTGARFTVTTASDPFMQGGYVVGSPLSAGRYVVMVPVYASGDGIGRTCRVYLIDDVSGLAGFSDTVLASGWNECYAEGVVTDLTVTVINVRIQFTGAQVGEVYDLDGIICQPPGQTRRPYVETSEPVVVYEPDTNLYTNGDFETNTTSWTGVNMSISRSSEQAHENTYSMKAVASGTGTVWAQGSYAPGGTIPVDAYGFGVWVYAPAGIVGKTIQLQVNEFGGAETQASIGSQSKLAKLGWNYLTASGTPAESDRTDLIPIVFLYGAAVNDTIYVDDFRLGDGFVADLPITASRAGGRIRVPTYGLSPRRGWVALSLRPGWTSYSATQTRPTMPLTLWRWADDANNRLQLTYDGGAVVLTRVASGNSETATAPAVLSRNTTTVIVAAWDYDGVSVSAGGGTFFSNRSSFLVDTFTRSNTTSGLGTSETGSFTWGASGASGCRIQGNRYEPGASDGNGYAGLDLGETPLRFGGITSYDGTDTEDANTTLISSYLDNNITDCVHIQFNRGGWNIQYREASGSFISLATKDYATDLATDGTTYPVAVSFDGDTCTVEGADGQNYAITDAKIGDLAGRYCIWEVSRDNGLISRWESVYAQRAASWSGASSNIPTLAATTADIGSDGTDGWLDGDVLWYATGRGALDSADCAAIAGLGSSDPTARAMPRRAVLRYIWEAETSAVRAFKRRVMRPSEGGVIFP